MVEYGLTLSSEEHPPEHLVKTARAAEGAGFDFVSISEFWANTGLPGQLTQDLRTVLHFEQAVKLVDENLIADQMNFGPDPEPILKSIGQAIDAGIDHVYLHQVGDPLDGFVDFWQKELQPNLPGR